ARPPPPPASRPWCTGPPTLNSDVSRTRPHRSLPPASAGFFMPGALMNTTLEGRSLIEAREGVRLKAYRDSVGIWTIGVGHTSAAGPPAVVPGLGLTAAQASDILRQDLAQFARAVAQA